ncbi:MAG: hypothetical protein AB1304_08595 [Bacteroidota bacterium]
MTNYLSKHICLILCLIFLWLFLPLIYVGLQLYLTNPQNLENRIKHNVTIKVVDLNVFQEKLLSNQKEIVLNNVICDIVDYQVLDNKVILKVYEDKEEQDTLDKLKRLFNILNNLLSQNIFINFYFSIDSYDIHLHQIMKLIKHTLFNEIIQLSPFLSKGSPPPKL